MTTECVSCNSVKVESMPFSEKKAFDYHPKRGVTLEFSKILEEE